LLFYTDGVTEAFSAEDEAFGDDRLQAVLLASGTTTAFELLDAIDAAVNVFIKDYPASDDITLIALKRGN
jgi:sigma-B regulation protein RsbU (phosphoserine phosphatase)